MRWRGSIETALYDVNDDSFQIVPDLFGLNAKSLDTLTADPAIAPLVASRVVTEVMCQPIDLNGNAGGFAEKIEHKRPKWMLPAKLQAVGTQPKRFPEPDLGRTHAFAKLARLVDCHVENPSTMLRMVPLPGKCRGGRLQLPVEQQQTRAVDEESANRSRDGPDRQLERSKLDAEICEGGLDQKDGSYRNENVFAEEQAHIVGRG